MGKVRKGEVFQPSAVDWNRFVDTANAFEQGRFQASYGRSTGNTVLAKNSTGGAVDQLGVMAIDGVVFSPTDAPEDFGVGDFVLDGGSPTVSTDAGSFVIAAQPIASGEIGRVWSSGVCPAKINVGATWHRYADVKTSTTELASYPGGGAEILWKESGTGAGKKAVIRFGPMPFVFAQFDIDTAMATTDSTEGADLNNCTVPGYDGNNVTLYNHDESGGNYIFEGDAGDKGTCWYSVSENKWYIVQMECP